MSHFLSHKKIGVHFFYSETERLNLIPLTDKDCFLLFSVDPNSEIASTQIVEEGDWESFRRRWFEVRIYQTTDKPLESLGGDEVNWPSVSSRASSFLNSEYYMHHGERSAGLFVGEEIHGQLE